MSLYALRFRRALSLSSALINATKSTLISSPIFHLTQNSRFLNPFQCRTFRSSSVFLSLRPRSTSYNSRRDEEEAFNGEIIFEGCDYNHWLITIDFPKDSNPSPEEMVEFYVQTAAQVVGSVEEAKKRIYACSTTTYKGFQIQVTEEMSEKFKDLPQVVFILPDSYIDPTNKEYGGDKYENGVITHRPPPMQHGRQGVRYNDRNRQSGSYQQSPQSQQNFTPQRNPQAQQNFAPQQSPQLRENFAPQQSPQSQQNYVPQQGANVKRDNIPVINSNNNKPIGQESYGNRFGQGSYQGSGQPTGQMGGNQWQGAGHVSGQRSGWSSRQTPGGIGRYGQESGQVSGQTGGTWGQGNENRQTGHGGVGGYGQGHFDQRGQR